MVWTHLTWSNVIILRLSIKQLLYQNIPLLELYIAPSLRSLRLASLNLYTGRHSNAHCAVPLPQLAFRKKVNTVLGADTFCPQTAITDVEYLTFLRPLALGITLPISAKYNRLNLCESCPSSSAFEFVIMQIFSNICTL